MLAFDTLPKMCRSMSVADVALCCWHCRSSLQTLGFKTLSLLVLPCLEPAPAAVVRGYVTARHNAVLERCAGMEAELADLKALVGTLQLVASQPGTGWLACWLALW